MDQQVRPIAPQSSGTQKVAMDPTLQLIGVIQQMIDQNRPQTDFQNSPDQQAAAQATDEVKNKPKLPQGDVIQNQSNKTSGGKLPDVLSLFGLDPNKDKESKGNAEASNITKLPVTKGPIGTIIDSIKGGSGLDKTKAGGAVSTIMKLFV